MLLVNTHKSDHLNNIGKIAFCINKAADFHYVVDHYVEHGVVSDVYAVIRLLPVAFRLIWFKPLRIA